MKRGEAGFAEVYDIANIYVCVWFTVNWCCSFLRAQFHNHCSYHDNNNYDDFNNDDDYYNNDSNDNVGIIMINNNNDGHYNELICVLRHDSALVRLHWARDNLG